MAISVVTPVRHAGAAEVPVLERGKAVDQLFAEFGTDTPGAAVGVFREGEVLYTKGYGMANLETAAVVTPETSFHIASLSKHFTAFAVLLLAHEGKVDLDADVRTYLPYVPDFGRKITVRHLILHTSGLRDQESLMNFAGLQGNLVLSQANVIELVSRQRSLSYAPGTEFSYNNTGYTLLAEIVRAASGMGLRQFAAERIFGPLQMRNTVFSDTLSDVVPGRANSYSRNDAGRWERTVLNQESFGATGIRTTVTDMARWANNFITPVVGDRRLIAEYTRAGTLDDGTPLPYGFGLDCLKIHGADSVSHDGAEAKFTSTFIHFMDQKLSVVVLGNTAAKTRTRAEQIAGIYLGVNAAQGTPAVESIPQRVQPSQQQSASLAGLYASFGAVLRLEYRDGKLQQTRSKDAVDVVLRADGTVDFGDEARGGGEYYQVIRAGNGTVQALQEGRAGESGRPIRYQRVRAVDAQRVDPKPYVGRYRSTELDATYSVYLNDGKLEARSLWSSKPLVLEPIYEDAFKGGSWMFSHIGFERRGGAKARALILSNGRARNVRFERVQ
ncbi:serine hydrolase domain-containing protein [Steroidobacter sp.]|uniref:serine hydrolase domain-containing protein n=1 Tax=Steroidobacter sp. TaxID=1978227 RepID=UPI001A406AC3|nr:serine hydrolase domain-containing protein [Steroidobacter sp.]MBL8268636.1 serine hydrolase [Steroidobacter sp.]